MPSVPAPPLILIVDDLIDAREMLGDCLERAGFRIALAGDGAEALVQARALLPALILMDLGLPVLDGRAATRQLKADPLTALIPVIALSGEAGDERIESARAAGCDVVVSKPYRPEDLVRVVRDRLRVP